MTHYIPAIDHQMQKAAMLKFSYKVAILQPAPKTTLKWYVGYIDEELLVAREKVQHINIDPKVIDQEDKDREAKKPDGEVD